MKLRNIAQTADFCHECDRHQSLRDLEERKHGIRRPVLVCRNWRDCERAQGKRR